MKQIKLLVYAASFTVSLTTHSLSVVGQAYVFKVLGMKGQVEVNGQPVKVGSMLQAGQAVTVPAGAYLGLAHHSNKTVEIKAQGNYKVSDLETKMNESTSSGLAARYAQFVIEELTSQDGQASRFHAKAKTGSVTREVFTSPVQFFMPTDQNGISKTSRVSVAWPVLIQWQPNEGFPLQKEHIQGYTFTVKDGSAENLGNILYQITSEQPAIVLDLSLPAFKTPRTLLYQVTVHLQGEKLISQELALQKIKADEEKTLEKSLKELGPIDQESPIGQMILGRFLEEKGLVAQALHAYQKAATLSEAPAFQKNYSDFLAHYQLTVQNPLSILANKQ